MCKLSVRVDGTMVGKIIINSVLTELLLVLEKNAEVNKRGCGSGFWGRTCVVLRKSGANSLRVLQELVCAVQYTLFLSLIAGMNIGCEQNKSNS